MRCVKCIGSFTCLRYFGFPTNNVRLIEIRIQINVCETSKNIPVLESSLNLSKSGLIEVQLIETYLYLDSYSANSQ